MVSLLELIFQGFAEWVYSLVLECWNYFSSSLLDIMSLDFAYIKTHIPVVNGIMQVFLAVGWALLLGNLIFQAIRSMASGLGFEGEDPKLLFARTFVFAFLLLASPQICEIGLDLTSRMIALLEIPDTIDVHLVDDSIFGSLTVSWFLIILFDIIIMFKVLSLLLEVAERYVILAVLSITAPLAFSMGGSRSTAEIFTGWCRMFGSMCLLTVTNVMFFKMLLSVVSAVPSGLDVFPWMVLIITIVKVAKKADEIITRIGLNPAITGDRGKGAGSVLAYTLIRSAAAKVIKTVGAAATGGAAVAVGAAAGGAAAVTGAAGAAGAAGAVVSAGTGGTAGAGLHTGTQRGSVQQTGAQQGQKPDGLVQSGMGEGGAGASGQITRRDHPSRRSSVPAGTRRAESHVSGGKLEKPGSGPGIPAGKAVGESAGGTGPGQFKRSGRKPAGRLRPVAVYADDFDDGYEDQGKSGAASAGGGSSAATGAVTPGSGIVTERRGGTTAGPAPQASRQTEARATRRDSGAPAGQPAVRHPGTIGAAEDALTASPPQGRQGSGTIRQGHRFTSAAAEAARTRSGTAGGEDGETAGSSAKRRGTGPAMQKASKEALIKAGKSQANRQR